MENDAAQTGFHFTLFCYHESHRGELFLKLRDHGMIVIFTVYLLALNTLTTTTIYVTSSMTSPFDCTWSLSYRLPIENKPLSATVSDIFSMKCYDCMTSVTTDVMTPVSTICVDPLDTRQ